MPRSDFRKVLTDKLIESIETTGHMPWEKGWNALPTRPFNAVSGVRYRGGNVLNLMLAGIDRDSDDPRWMTLKQANAKGYSVRAGSRAAFAEYWDFPDQAKAPRVREVDAQGNPIDEEDEKKAPRRVGGSARPPLALTDEEEEQEEPKRRPTVFFAALFNGKDIVGLPELDRTPKWDANALAERLIAATGAHIEHRAVSRAGRRVIENAAYNDVAADKCVVPPKSAFKSAEDYYATTLHELVHWTGHPSRLNRHTAAATFGSPEYAREELRAEIGAMLVAASLGIEGKVQNHASYVSNWLEVLKKDKHEIFRAAREAEQAVDHLFSYDPELKQMLDEATVSAVVEEAVKPARSGVSVQLPDFRPAGPVGPSATPGEAGVDIRWPGFEALVREEGRKYGIDAVVVQSVLDTIQTRFTSVMDAGERNGYTVDDLKDMLTRSLVEDMKAAAHWDAAWVRYAHQVRGAAIEPSVAPEELEGALERMEAEVSVLRRRAANEQWDADKLTSSLNQVMYGQSETGTVDLAFVRRWVLSRAELGADARVADGLILTPSGSGAVWDEDVMPEDAAAMSDDTAHTPGRTVRHMESEVFNPS